ncbi:coatomer protein [Irpex rosettiformis]|uniref:Coatomer protein n=1 Tax=Irpex rosettiformis TaxID=378272 RepID=A0ACB8U8V8_9APHY|nr:coatomer protein [Irpex rosettiformis]
MSLSLYTISGFVITDTDGHRVLAKYYNPPGNPTPSAKKLMTLKEQRAFEKGLFQKTKKAGGEIILYDGFLSVYKHSLDLIIYIIADQSANELMLLSALVSFTDAASTLLRNQLEKRSVLENLDLVLLCLDETIDDGVIVETDSAAIASRVSRPKADTTEIVINEQTLMSAYLTVKDKVQQRIQQL